MRNSFLIIIFFISYNLYSQVEIDTSRIVITRFEYDSKNRLTEKLIEYESGLFKQIFNPLDSTRIHTFLYNSDNHNRIHKLKFKFYIESFGEKAKPAYRKYYYDNYENLDSIQYIYTGGELKNFTYIIEKKYKSKGKLKYYVDYESEFEYEYGFFGKLKRITESKNNEVIKIEEYKKGKLIKAHYPKQRDYRQNINYAYDKKNRLVKKDHDIYTYTKYTYNDFGIFKIQKFINKDNILRPLDYEKYSYNEKGELVRKTQYSRNDKIQWSYNYKYK